MATTSSRLGGKLTFVASVSILSLVSGSSVAFANDDDWQYPVEATTSSGGEVILQPGEYYEEGDIASELAELGFETLDSELGALGPEGEASARGPATCVGCYSSSYETKTNGTRTRVYKAFVKHLTPAWAKASSYSWGRDVTVASSLSASIGPSAGAVAGSIGVSASVTRSWNVAVSIPADKKKFSKLSFRSDFYSTPVKSRLVQKAVLKPTLYGQWKSATHMAPISGAQYLVVTYQ
ncbi:MAG: hypothetical protein ACTH30_07430 [Leucobacter sp.]